MKLFNRDKKEAKTSEKKIKKARPDYLSMAKARVHLYTRQKTGNILDGSYVSLYKGRSMEFLDLMEYNFGDNIRDIDWRASSRTGKTLVRRYEAEKRHNVLFLCDSGVKMSGDTITGQRKSELALTCFSALAYIVSELGADFSLTCCDEKGIQGDYMRSGSAHIEALLSMYEKTVESDPVLDINTLIEKAISETPRRRIIVVITDADGMSTITDSTIRKANVKNDLYILCLTDGRLAGGGAFDLDITSYAEDFIFDSKAIAEAESTLKEQQLQSLKDKCVKEKVGFVTLSSDDEILDKAVTLFEQQLSI
ncbi:MAG: DUF58 domain-containing protein [Pseudobutyrivibrio sp.]|nr:DUF58 domain-containing protein [Pseudobutyrivibrio sp.]